MFKKETYSNRRNHLRKTLKNGIVLFLANSESPKNYFSNHYKFRQDSNFLYFFGIDLPDLAGIIDLDEDKDYVFGNDMEIEDIVWLGPKPTVAQNAAKVGISNTATLNQLSEFLQKAQEKGRNIHFLPPYRATNMLWLERLLGIPALLTKDAASIDLIKAIVELRSIKDEQEIIEIDHACDIAYEMHTTAMRLARPGVYEREIAGTIEGIALAHGGTLSFETICSKHGETLHNFCYDNLLQAGDLLLVDAGCENSNHYVSDFTRVIPVSGKFSPKQREIYEIVLAANNNTYKTTKPDIKYQEVHDQAAKIIASGLKELGFLKGTIDDIITEGAHALFFPHGLGHMIGLDAHDMEDLGENYVGYDDETSRSTQFGKNHLRLAKQLKTGYVLSNEPGIYFIPELIDLWLANKKFFNFINYDKVNEYRGFGGIRIEDDILITETGCRILGQQRIPVTIAEIEAIAGKDK